jgi:acetyl-CoA carboxylase biotin carboxyl carrier protein
MTDDAAVPAPEPADPGMSPDAADPATPDQVVAPAEAEPAAGSTVAVAPPPRDPGDAELLRLIDRLAALLDRSDLTELEVEAGGTGLVLRKPAALAPVVTTTLTAPAVPAAAETAGSPGSTPGEPSAAGREGEPGNPSVKAPLTGIFYASPAPGSAPYVQVGGEVAVGQLIGLIEAMKLFNEIKSDLAGRVVRVVPESGTLVKAKQPLIEVVPL